MKEKKYMLIIVAILVSIGIGNYIRIITGMISYALYGFAITMVASLCIMMYILWIHKKKQVYVSNLERGKIIFVNVISCILCVIYLAVIEMVSIIFVPGDPMMKSVNVLVLVIVILFFVVETVVDLIKMK